jgi:hypothetical protein
VKGGRRSRYTCRPLKTSDFHHPNLTHTIAPFSIPPTSTPSFSNTVGTYNGNAQKNFTRVVGPSENNWLTFERKYDWWEPLKTMVQAQMYEQLHAQATARGERVPAMPELWDLHVLRQRSSASTGGAVFSDHQDRHAEERYNKPFVWTITLLISMQGESTGFYQWGGSGRAEADGPQQGGVISYDAAGVGVMFPSLAWHRTVIPAIPEGSSFSALKMSFFFVAPSDRSIRYHTQQERLLDSAKSAK